ncbi:hypothetical protein Tco_1083038 [Tanacetum coccineum]|uniref:Uncharacterized protein n=1 Tax=Tanacetum coccineum TaxID=301880 RepID=A0ABQ5I479_9ASTR
MKESLWVKWINEVRLKGNSIWEIESDVNSSYDLSMACRWWGPEPLIKTIPLEVIRQAGLEPSSKLKDMISNGEWKWPKEWNSTYNQCLPNTNTVPSLINGVKDIVVWETNDGKCYNYQPLEHGRNGETKTQKWNGVTLFGFLTALPNTPL